MKSIKQTLSVLGYCLALCTLYEMCNANFFAHAQVSQPTNYPVDYSLTLGTTPVQVLPALTQFHTRSYLLLQIVTNGASVACSWTTNSPTIWGKGSWTMAGQAAPFTYTTNNIPGAALWCVASQANTNMTVTSQGS